MVIISVNNEHIKKLCKLKEKKVRDAQALFMAFGYHLVMEAYNTNLIKEVLALEGVTLPLDLNITYVSEPVMKKLTDLDSTPKVMAVVHKPKEKPITDKILILDDLQDPGNLGTIIRSAVAFDFKTIVVSPKTVDAYNSKVIRSTQGMIFHINIVVKDIACFINNIKTDGYTVYGTNVRNGLNIRDTSLPTKLAIVIGNEGNGISREVAKLCDANIFIPMDSDVESLNAGVAASIIMYEVNNHELC